jgi:hypothetical protein
LDASLIQIVGIMPTLIIAQIGVGRAVHDIEANFRMTHIETAPVSTSTSSKMEIRITYNGIDAQYAPRWWHCYSCGYKETYV